MNRTSTSGAPATVIRAVVVDDDARLLGVVARGLALHGFDVLTFADPAAALNEIENRGADVVVLDVMMPTLDGISFCRRLRESLAIPILMLSARDTVPDRILGLESGADDYLTKPFEIAELAARLRALMRRGVREPAEEMLAFGDLELDARRHTVKRAGEELSLTPIEFRLLEYFMRQPDAVLSRDAIIRGVWGYQAGDSNSLDVHIGHLRDKLEANGKARVIQTVRSFGYALQRTA